MKTFFEMVVLIVLLIWLMLSDENSTEGFIIMICFAIAFIFMVFDQMGLIYN